MTLDEALAQLHRLPAIPSVVQEVVDSFNNSNIDIDALVRNIGRDQALTAKLLRVANSSFYGFPRAIASLHDAVVIMGLAGVRSLVLSAGLMHAFNQTGGGTLDRDEYWKHSFRLASYAKAVATCLKQPSEVAFTAGLLHDIGQLVLATCLPEQYAAVLDKAQTEGGDLVAAELDILGFHHGTLGGEIARRWNFPAVIEQSIRDCHTAPAEALAPISVAVCLAVHLDRGENLETVLASAVPTRTEIPGLDVAQLAAALPDREQLDAGISSLLG